MSEINTDEIRVEHDGYCECRPEEIKQDLCPVDRLADEVDRLRAALEFSCDERIRLAKRCAALREERATAWDEGFAAKEEAMRDPRGTGWEPNPYRQEQR